MRIAVRTSLLLVLAAVLVAAPTPPRNLHVNPPTLSKPTGYTHVVEARGGRTIYVSGQVALDASGALVGAGDFKAQTERVFENLKLALVSSRAGFDDVVKITIFVTDASQVQTFREVRDRYFPGEKPASTFVQVVRLARPEFLREVEAIAVAE
jgi:enamine deaminase RidA (YjgF/YER057c/UK114 family)